MDFNALQDTLGAHTAGGGLSTSGNLATLESRYELLEEVGKGAYGVVWKARRRNGSNNYYAIKHVSKQRAGSKGLHEVMGEVETMSLLSHPNIVKLEETFQDEKNLWIVMEFLPDGELQSVLNDKTLPESTVRRVVTQLLMAIEYIHDKGVVHRDLKPANCLVSLHDYTIKISDFGFAVLAGTDQCLSTYCGTVIFMAPEILREKNYGKPVDMWAIGVMTYYMFLGSYPFSGQSAAALKKNICATKASSQNKAVGMTASPRLQQFPLLQDFISKLLTPDPIKRLSAREALTHPWIKAGINSLHRTSISPSTHVTTRPLSRLRAAAVAVVIAQRLRYLQQCTRLQRLGYGNIPYLRNYHFLVTGDFDPGVTRVDCSHMFESKPQALTELFVMIDACPYVEQVILCYNNIDSLSTVQSFLKLVSRHPTIHTIDLSHNPIPALAGRGLVRLARNPMARVRTILVEDTSLSADTVAQIKAGLRDRASLPSHTNHPSVSSAADGSRVSHPSSASFPQLSAANARVPMTSDEEYSPPLSSATPRSRVDDVTRPMKRRPFHPARLPPLPRMATTSAARKVRGKLS